MFLCVLAWCMAESVQARVQHELRKQIMAAWKEEAAWEMISTALVIRGIS